MVLSAGRASAFAAAALLFGCSSAADPGTPDAAPTIVEKQAAPAEEVPPVLKLIASLGSTTAEERDRATSALLDMGPAALPQLRMARADATDEEVRLRIDRILSTINRSRFTVCTRLDATGEEGAWRPDGRQFALGRRKDVLIYDASSWTLQACIKPRQAVRDIWGIDYSPSGTRLAVAYDLGIAIYRADSAECELWIPSIRPSRGLRFLDEDRVACRDLLLTRRGGTWSAQDPPWKNDVNPGVGGFDVCRSTKRIAFSTTSQDRLKVQVYDSETYAPTTVLRLGTFSSHWSGELYFWGKFLVATGEADEVVVWGTDSWVEVCRGRPHHRSILGAGRSSPFLFTAGSDGWLRAWTPPAWSEVVSFATLAKEARLFVSPARDEIVISPREGSGEQVSTVVRLFRPE